MTLRLEKLKSGLKETLRRSDETRRKISEACKGEKNGFYGKHHSEEAKLKMKLAWERRRCK